MNPASTVATTVSSKIASESNTTTAPIMIWNRAVPGVVISELIKPVSVIRIVRPTVHQFAGSVNFAPAGRIEAAVVAVFAVPATICAVPTSGARGRITGTA